MKRPLHFWRIGLAWWAAFGLAVDAAAQRVQFPTSVPPDSPFYTGPAADPSAALGGTIQPVAPAWDPYAGGTVETPVLEPDPGYIRADGTVVQPQRLVQRIGIENVWLAGGNGANDFGIETLETAVSFGFPFLGNPNPVLVTPGFAVHFFDGPNSLTAAGHPDLPGAVYDAFLDTAWQPRVTSWLSGDLSVRVGVYSDFEKVNSDSIRVTGKGLGVLTFNPRVSLALGVVYLNRQNVKLLPAGGVIWTPNEDNRFEIIFPMPKAAHRFATTGNTDWWWYVIGRYGGGMWTVERVPGGFADRATYNDLRVGVGIEALNFRGWRGWFDVSYVWDREILYVSQMGNNKPSDTVALSAGISF